MRIERYLRMQDDFFVGFIACAAQFETGFRREFPPTKESCESARKNWADLDVSKA